MGYYIDTSGSPELLYDELKMLMELDLNLKNDIAKPNIKKFQLKLNDKHSQRNAPMRNKLKMTQNEYQEFLSSFGMSANQFKKYMNDVFMIDGLKTGIMTDDEVDLSVVFLDKQANLNFIIEAGIEKFLEQEFWYDQFPSVPFFSSSKEDSSKKDSSKRDSNK